jgi:hypothetical protein
VDDGGGDQILQGKYLLTGIGGVKPGKYRVKLYVTQYYDIKTEEPSTAETGEFDNVHVNMIPKEFNDDLPLEFEVIPRKKNVFNFDIVTDYVPDAESAIRNARNRNRSPAQCACLKQCYILQFSDAVKTRPDFTQAGFLSTMGSLSSDFANSTGTPIMR